ncbi:MAG: anti-sigma factor family protein [Archangium sp.]
MKNAVHQYEDKLLEFAYGELPQHEADAVDAHVRGCTKCTQALTEIRSVRSAMSTLPMEAAPDAGLESLMAFAEQAAKRNAQTATPVPFWKKYLTPLVAVMTVVMVGVFGFRSSEAFDTSPAAAAADAKLAEKNEKKRDEYPAKADVPQAVAPSPEPIAAAQPEAAPIQEEELNGEGSSEKLGMGGKRAVAKELQNTRKPTSETRRQFQGNAVSEDGLMDLKKQDNWSDTGARGMKQQALREEKSKVDEPVKEAPPPPPATKTADKGGLTFGLGGGGISTAPTEAPATDEAARKDSNKIVARTPAPTAPPPAQVATAPEPSVGGYGRGGSSSMSSGPSGVKAKKSLDLGTYRTQAADDDENAALEKSDAVGGVDRDVKLLERQREQRRAKSLESARLSNNSGDRTSEIRFAQEALSEGATGSQRVEALKRLCDAWEALGEPGRADPYCVALIREFPTSLAAKNVSDRRNRMLRVPSPAKAEKKSSGSYDFEDAEKKPEPAKSQPADAVEAY